MQLRIQVMFLAAFMIACAMCLASLASADALQERGLSKDNTQGHGPVEQ